MLGISGVTNRISTTVKDRFIKSIMLLASGSILAQLITLLCSPILTRIYSTSQMGDFGYVLAIVTMFTCVINGRYDVAIVSSKDEEEAIATSYGALIIALILSLLVGGSSYIYVVLQDIRTISSTNYVLWVVPLLLITGIVNVLNSYNNRHRDYRVMTDVYLIRSVSQNTLMIILGVTKFGVLGLLVGQFAGQLFGLKKQSKRILSNSRIFKQCKTESIKAALVEHKAQPLYSAPSTFTNALSYSLISIFIGGLFGIDVLGKYSIAYRVLSLPLGVFSRNIAKVHYENALTERSDTGGFVNSTKKTITIATAISLPMVILLIALSPKLFPLVFGEEWRDVGKYVQILAPMYGARLIMGSVGFGYIIARKQKWEFVTQCLYLISVISAYLCNKHGYADVTNYLMIISILFTIVCILEIFLILYLAKGKSNISASLSRKAAEKT